MDHRAGGAIACPFSGRYPKMNASIGEACFDFGTAGSRDGLGLEEDLVGELSRERDRAEAAAGVAEERAA